MKKIIIILILTFVSILNQFSFAQCNVSTDSLDNGTKYFLCANEKIYDNDDLENGILVAYVQLVVFQNSVNKNLLQFAMLVDVGKSGSKQMVVPRQIKIYFTDDTTIELTAETLESPRMEKAATIDVYMQKSTFRLNSGYYTTLQNKSISKIVISDNRTSNQLLCTPYKDILKEQANCIVPKLK